MLKKLGAVLVLLASALMLIGAGKQTQEQENCSHESWKNGVCAVCGAEPVFYEELLPEKYYQPCPHPGKVEEINYTSPVYYQENSKYVLKRRALVYVPYDQDPGTKYNVMVLLPGGGQEPKLWLTYASDMQMPGVLGQTIIDNLIYYNDIEPTIFIAMYTPESVVDRWALQYADELRYDVLPMICSAYPTFAEEATSEGIQAVREHFAVGGCSDGGIYAYSIGLMYARDLFGNVMALSPQYVPQNVVDEVAKGEKEDEVHMLYIGAGNREGNTKRSKAEYDKLLGACSWLEEGRNAFYNTSIGIHNWRTWRTQMASAVQLIF